MERLRAISMKARAAVEQHPRAASVDLSPEVDMQANQTKERQERLKQEILITSDGRSAHQELPLLICKCALSTLQCGQCPIICPPSPLPNASIVHFLGPLCLHSPSHILMDTSAKGRARCQLIALLK